MRKQVGWAVSASTSVIEHEVTNGHQAVFLHAGAVIEHQDNHKAKVVRADNLQSTDNMTLLVARAVERANVSPSRTVAGRRIRKVLKKYEK